MAACDIQKCLCRARDLPRKLVFRTMLASHVCHYYQMHSVAKVLLRLRSREKKALRILPEPPWVSLKYLYKQMNKLWAVDRLWKQNHMFCQFALFVLHIREFCMLDYNKIVCIDTAVSHTNRGALPVRTLSQNSIAWQHLAKRLRIKYKSFYKRRYGVTCTVV